MRPKGITNSNIPMTTRLFRTACKVTALAALTVLVTSGSLKLRAESDNPTAASADGPLVQVVLTATAKHNKTPELSNKATSSSTRDVTVSRSSI